MRAPLDAHASLDANAPLDANASLDAARFYAQRPRGSAFGFA